MSAKLDHEAYIRDVADKLSATIQQTLRGISRNCMTCESFDQTKERCDRYNARPPAAVIVRGCDEYINDIPF